MHRPDPPGRAELRLFGIALAVLIALGFGWLLPALAGRPWPRWPWIVALVLAPLAAFAPQAIRPLHRLLHPLLRALAAANNAVLLGAVYFLLLWPLGLVLRVSSRLHYRTGFDADAPSYRVQIDPGRTTNLEEPF